VKTFTIGSTARDYDESSDARSVAAQLGTDHTELIVTEADALRVVEQLGAIHDEPFADSSQVPTRLVAELARKMSRSRCPATGETSCSSATTGTRGYPGMWKQLERTPMALRRRGAAALGAVPPQ
jgi:asparagine synthase (glutamine-hydrolysing)